MFYIRSFQKRPFLIFLLTLFIFSTYVIFEQRQAKQIQRGASDLTFIVTTNPIPSIPSTEILYQSMKSFYKNKTLRASKKIIVFDGIQPGYLHRKADYEQYKKNVEKLTQTSPYFSNTELIFCTEWSHISGAIKTAIQKVNTPFIFIHQHDFSLEKDINVIGLLKTMKKNENIKYVRLNQWRNKPHKKSGFHYYFDGDVDEKILGTDSLALCRTFGWTDNDHFARTDYYTDFVLPNCEFGAMEWYMDKMYKRAAETDREAAHRQFGTYILGSLKDGKHIRHLDGRQSCLK